MAAAQYRVVVPYVTLKVVDPMSGAWTFKGYYLGAVLDVDDVEPASLRHHVDGSMLVKVDAPEPTEEPTPPAKTTSAPKAKA